MRPASTANVDNVGADLVLCMAGSNATTIEMAEVIAATGPITDADVADVTAYLDTKFGL